MSEEININDLILSYWDEMSETSASTEYILAYIADVCEVEEDYVVSIITSERMEQMS